MKEEPNLMDCHEFQAQLPELIGGDELSIDVVAGLRADAAYPH